VSIRLRLTLWYGLTFMLLVSLAGLGVWWQFERSLRGSLEEALRIHAQDVADDLEQGMTPGLALEPAVPGIFVALADPATGAVDQGPGVPAGLPIPSPGTSSLRLVPDGPLYVLFGRSLSDGRLLVTGSSLAGVERSAAQLPELLIVIGTLCAVGSLLGGWWLAGRALSPIRRLIREADAIGPDELDRRLPVVRPEDEIGQLAATLNGLLARIEEGVRRERIFIAGAAHDLRTPIAALRLRLDLLLHRGVGGPEARVALEEARQDAIGLGELADGLLGLARAQETEPGDVRAVHGLAVLVSRAVQEIEWRAREREVRIEQTVEDGPVRLSAVRFHQALANLLSNAVRHGPLGGLVTIEARLDTSVPGQGRVVLVEVSDQGPGIDPQERDRLFVPFGIERPGTTAHGLGLATAAVAVRSQGGEIGYRQPADGGSLFWFRLPADVPAAAAG
jgi:signal transduction histidine kinase